MRRQSDQLEQPSGAPALWAAPLLVVCCAGGALVALLGGTGAAAAGVFGRVAAGWWCGARHHSRPGVVAQARALQALPADRLRAAELLGRQMGIFREGGSGELTLEELVPRRRLPAGAGTLPGNAPLPTPPAGPIPAQPSPT